MEKKKLHFQEGDSSWERGKERCCAGEKKTLSPPVHRRVDARKAWRGTKSKQLDCVNDTVNLLLPPYFPFTKSLYRHSSNPNLILDRGQRDGG